MKRIIVLTTSDGYQALYLDGKLYDEGNPLGEGNNALYFLKLHEKFEKEFNQIITSEDIAFECLSEADECNPEFGGIWPKDIIDFLNSYEQP